MKVWTNQPHERWIVDRYAEEWRNHNSDISVSSPYEADKLWIMADWCWNQIPVDLLNSKKVIITCHHFVPEKFGGQEQWDFIQRDRFIDMYHVPCVHTANQIHRLTKKPIKIIPFWVNQNIWIDLTNEEDKTLSSNVCPASWNRRQRLKKELFGLTEDDFVIGNFHRNIHKNYLQIENFDLFERFLKNALDALKFSEKELYVLTDKTELLDILEKYSIKNVCIEAKNNEKLNQIYNCLDLYIEINDNEQSSFECALINAPIVSTSKQNQIILHPDSINSSNIIKAVANVDFAFDKVCNFTIPNGFNEFIKIFHVL